MMSGTLSRPMTKAKPAMVRVDNLPVDEPEHLEFELREFLRELRIAGVMRVYIPVDNYKTSKTYGKCRGFALLTLKSTDCASHASDALDGARFGSAILLATTDRKCKLPEKPTPPTNNDVIHGPPLPTHEEFPEMPAAAPAVAVQHPTRPIKLWTPRSSCAESDASSAITAFALTCSYCKKEGHKITECLQLRSRKCAYCDEYGHTQLKCPTKKQDEDAKKRDEDRRQCEQMLTGWRLTKVVNASELHKSSRLASKANQFALLTEEDAVTVTAESVSSPIVVCQPIEEPCPAAESKCDISPADVDAAPANVAKRRSKAKRQAAKRIEARELRHAAAMMP